MPVVNNTLSVRELFEGRTFTIPNYQRAYSWGNREIRDFLGDLDNLPSNRDHYTGTVVLHADSSRRTVTDQLTKPLTPVDVVDGQQRLTTIVIMLYLIKQELLRLNGIEDRLALEIQHDFVETTDRHGRSIPRLTLNSGTDRFFRSKVISGGQTQRTAKIASEKRLERAKERIKEHLDSRMLGSNHDESVAEMWDLLDKVTNRVRFSLYEVEQEADVGVIFEVMNDRGKGLTDLEKVKNYLLYASTKLGIPNDLGPQVNEAWSEILQMLMRAGLEESEHENALLRVHWIIDQDPQSRGWKRVSSVKDSFDVRNEQQDPSELRDSLERYTDGLQETSIPFGDAYNPAPDTAFATFENHPDLREQVQEWSTKLGRLRAEAIFVPILAAVRLVYPDDAMKYLETLKLCENYAFRVFRLRGSRTDAGQSEFFRVAHELRNGTINHGDAMRRLRSELAWRCDDIAFERSISELVERRSWYEWRGLRYFLYEYEIHLSNKRSASARVTWEDLTKRKVKETVEHILPQSIENVQYWRDRFDDETFERCVHDLGNLSLTRYNASLGNRPFPEKKGNIENPPSYAASPLFQEIELTVNKHWTETEINTRRERLLDWARGRWSIDLSDADAHGVHESPDEEDEESW